MDNFKEITGAIIEGINKLEGRNSGERIFECDFDGKIVNTFIKRGSLLSGKFQGACGMKKDNERVYCCQQCYPRRS